MKKTTPLFRSVFCEKDKKLIEFKTQTNETKSIIIKSRNLKKQQNQDNFKEISLPNNFDLLIYFQKDRLIFEFFSKIFNEHEIYDVFKNYLAFIQDENIKEVLKYFYSKKQQENFKKTFILEKISIFICFYMELKNIYKVEIEFLKKIFSIVYANCYMFIKSLIVGSENDKYEAEIKELQSRKIILNEENLSENITKLIKMLTSILEVFDPQIKSCVSKIIDFIDDFSIKEAFKYLMDVFIPFVK